MQINQDFSVFVSAPAQLLARVKADADMLPLHSTAEWVRDDACSRLTREFSTPTGQVKNFLDIRIEYAHIENPDQWLCLHWRVFGGIFTKDPESLTVIRAVTPYSLEGKADSYYKKVINKPCLINLSSVDYTNLLERNDPDTLEAISCRVAPVHLLPPTDQLASALFTHSILTNKSALPRLSTSKNPLTIVARILISSDGQIVIIKDTNPDLYRKNMRSRGSLAWPGGLLPLPDMGQSPGDILSKTEMEWLKQNKLQKLLNNIGIRAKATEGWDTPAVLAQATRKALLQGYLVDLER